MNIDKTIIDYLACITFFTERAPGLREHLHAYTGPGGVPTDWTGLLMHAFERQLALSNGVDVDIIDGEFSHLTTWKWQVKPPPPPMTPRQALEFLDDLVAIGAADTEILRPLRQLRDQFDNFLSTTTDPDYAEQNP